ncbi:ATP-binding response regulator [Desulfobacter sp.]|uniref:ATP-binding response regulator n=1 Tax=Desulfobacter sp. TaxID=2294 RepID=UPI003D13B6FF
MKRILTIDDNQDNLVTVKALLKHAIPGCEVIAASSGEEGLQKAIIEKPDTILLDIHMPGMDGFETCRELKQIRETAHIPVIMLTAIRTDSSSRVRALDLGADAFLTKPIEESELAAQVKAMLRIKQAEDRLRNEKEDLEKLVEQRVNELRIANAQLLMEMDERQLAQNELEIKSSAIENALTGFGILDSRECFIYVNKAIIRMWGYDDGAQVISMPLADHCLDPGILDRLRLDLSAKGECKIEFTAKQRDGSLFEVQMYTHRSRDAEGKRIYPVTCIDITDQKKAQSEKKKLEKQLIQSQKMEAVGALAAGIAHDFNNVLSPIIGFSELLKEDIPDDSPMIEYASEIFNAANRARSLVKQILTFSRQMDQEVRPIKIQSILIEVINLTHAVIPSTITIVDDIDKTCKPILADPTQIHQMIMNMVTNAFHAMETTGGTLKIRLGPVHISKTVHRGRPMTPGEYNCLTIEDTGTGIPKAILSYIFDPYFTTKAIEKGTGLGLSVAHGTAKSAHGEIFVESEEGKGTTFDIYLPVKQEKPTALTFKPQTLPRGDEHILLVDDEPLVTNVISQMLKRLGYEVTSINDPCRALEVFHNTPGTFDMLISDLTMPGLTGDQLAEKILADAPDLPVLICSGYSDALSESQIKKIGIKALVMKPVVLPELSQTIREIFDGKNSMSN